MLSSPLWPPSPAASGPARRIASPSGRSSVRRASRRPPPNRWLRCRRSPSARPPRSPRHRPGSEWSSPADQVLRQFAGAQAGFGGDLDIAVPLLQKRFSACISLMSSSPRTLSTSTALRRVDSCADCFASSASFFCSSRPQDHDHRRHRSDPRQLRGDDRQHNHKQDKNGRSTMVEMVEEVTISRICSSSRSWE